MKNKPLRYTMLQKINTPPANESSFHLYAFNSAIVQQGIQQRIDAEAKTDAGGFATSIK